MIRSASHPHVFYVRLTPGGHALEHWREMLLCGAYPGMRADERIFQDAPRRGKPLKLENLPGLQQAVQTLESGGRLVVCTMAHFANPSVWHWVATECARRGAAVQDLDSGKKFDVASDAGAAFEAAALLEEQVRRQRTEKARAAAVRLGHVGRRASLDADQKSLCRAMWVETDRHGGLRKTTQQIAEHFQVSEPTLRRAMTADGTQAGRQVGRLEAVELHRQGLWLSGGKPAS